jgi:putative CocE/NonD family hydrolase
MSLGLLSGCFATPSSTSPTAGVPLHPGFSKTAVFQGTYQLDDHSHTLVAGSLQALPGEVTKIKGRLDGADIELGYVRPQVAEGERVPIILQASPYYSKLTPATLRSQFGFGKDFLDDFVSHGYAVALVSVRGTGDSGGCMDFLGPSEQADLDSALTWLGEQPWSSGRIGLMGISYPGSTPWEAAATGNPHVQTIVPMEGINDYFQLDYRNGTANVFRLGQEFNGYYVDPLLFAPTKGTSPGNIVSQANCPESWKAGYAQVASSVRGDRDALGFWAARNLRPAILQKYHGSAFIVEGFWDDNVDPAQPYPFARQLEDRGLLVKHLLGQFGHQDPGGRPSNGVAIRPDWSEILLHWFDHELKQDLSVDPGPGASIQDSSGAWRTEDAWPPRDAKRTVSFLTGDGQLTPSPSSSRADQYVTPMAPVPGKGGWAPGDVWERPAQTVCAMCPTFTSAALIQDLRFAGLPRIELQVTPSGPGGYLAASLFAVNGASVTELGLGGGIDLRFADGGETMHTVVPDQPLDVAIELEPMDALVPAGSSLRLVLHQGGYADHVPPPDTFPVRVALGGTEARLVLDTFERDASSVFVPPGH